MPSYRRAFALVVGVAMASRGVAASPEPDPPSPPPEPPAGEPAPAGEAPPEQDHTDELNARLAALQAHLDALRAQLDEAEAAREAHAHELEQRLDDVSDQVGGRTRDLKLVIAGTATTSYTRTTGEPSSFAASLSPHFLWSFYDRVLFESHIDVRASDAGNSLNLEFAAAWLVIDDHVVIGAGKLLAPFGFYTEAIHTAWLNRLPDEPLPVADHVGLTPTHLIGVEARGVFELDEGRLAVALYGGSAGVLDLSAQGQVHGGLVDFDHFEHAAFGGRVSYRPDASLEIGASSQVGRVDPHAPPAGVAAPGTVMSWIAGFDVSYGHVVPRLSGALDLKAEYVVSALRQSEGSTFDRTRQGLYLQAAYSPTQADEKWLRHLEGVVRYDRLGPSTMIQRIDRVAIGANYWLTASIVGKLAGERNWTSAGERSFSLLSQIAVGF